MARASWPWPGPAGRAGKRVIVFKAGRTALGAQAAASHTASLAGDYAVAHACLTAAGRRRGGIAGRIRGSDQDLHVACTADRPAAAGRHPEQRRIRMLHRHGRAGRSATRRPSTPAPAPSWTRPCRPTRTATIRSTPRRWPAPTAGRARRPPSSPARRSIARSCPRCRSRRPWTICRAIRRGGTRRISRRRIAPPALLDIVRGATQTLGRRDRFRTLYDPMAGCSRAGMPVFRKIDRAVRALAAFCRRRCKHEKVLDRHSGAGRVHRRSGWV